MAKSKKKNTSVKEVEVIEDVELEEVEDEELEEVEDEVEEAEDEVEEIEDEVEDNDEDISLEERMANIEKKTNANFWMTIVILVISCFTLIVSLTTSNGSKDTDTNTQEEETTGYDTSAFKAIKPKEIESLSSGKTIVVWIGFQECQFCQKYAPLLTQVTKEYNITANYIDISTITEDEFNVITSLTGKGDWAEFAASFTGTPFTLIIKNNKVVGGINGYVDADGIRKAFDNAGFEK